MGGLSLNRWGGAVDPGVGGLSLNRGKGGGSWSGWFLTEQVGGGEERFLGGRSLIEQVVWWGEEDFRAGVWF